MASSSPGKCDFVDQAPEDIHCIICTSILREPVQIECCGQLFCEECLNKWLKKYRKCPYCRNTDLKYIKDRRMKRFINSFKIYCPNRSNGCQETTTGVDCNDHLEKCLFVKVACVNTCGTTILRKNVPHHMANECPKRQVHCQYCNEEGMHKDIVSEHHTNTCPLLPIDCPNNCKLGKIQRRDMPDHLKECPLEPIKCPFSHTGCKEVIPRKEMETHKMFNADTHIELALTTVSETNTKLKDMTHFARDLQDQLDELTEDSTAAQNKLERTILEVQKKSQATQNELIATKGELRTTKNQFKAAQNEFKASTAAQNKLERNMLAVQEKSEATQRELRKTRGELSSTQRALNQLSSKFDRLMSKLARQETTDPSITQAAASTHHTTKQPSLIMLTLGKAYTLPINRENGYKSPSFYLPPGYRVFIAIRLYEFIACNLYLEKGKFDAQLKWPISKFTITLSTTDHQSYCTVTICRNCGYTVPRLVGTQREAIFTGQKHSGDSLFSPGMSAIKIVLNEHFCS